MWVSETGKSGESVGQLDKKTGSVVILRVICTEQSSARCPYVDDTHMCTVYEHAMYIYMIRVQADVDIPYVTYMHVHIMYVYDSRTHVSYNWLARCSWVVAHKVTCHYSICGAASWLLQWLLWFLFSCVGYFLTLKILSFSLDYSVLFCNPRAYCHHLSVRLGFKPGYNSRRVCFHRSLLYLCENTGLKTKTAKYVHTTAVRFMATDVLCKLQLYLWQSQHMADIYTRLLTGLFTWVRICCIVVC